MALSRESLQKISEVAGKGGEYVGGHDKAPAYLRDFSQGLKEAHKVVDDMNRMVQQRKESMPSAVGVAKQILEVSKSLHGLPVFFNVGIVPFGKQKKRGVTQT